MASSGGSGGSLAGQTITVYSGQHEQTMGKLVQDFTARTGVKVQLRSGDEAELANQLLVEGSASPADVYVAENPPALTTLENKGLLAKVTASTLAAVPAGDSSAQGDWVGLSAREAAFVYNTGKVTAAQAPTAIKDLASAAWKGRLGIAPSETDFSPVVSLMIKQQGVAATKTWLQALKDNAKVYGSNEDLVAAVNRGDVAGGVIDHYYWYRLRDEQGASGVHSTMSYFAKGDPGALVDVSGAGVLASSKHQAAAQAFLAYLVSKPAQQIIATSESYEYPLLAGVTDTRLSRPLDQSGPIASPAELGDGKQALQLMQSVGLLS
ncbi:iron ABC transporter substrate-binding protein [Streptacidiphilus pinicola]|uniref:iron ABC transporter substrate-binding protein n=1 Tax=Streptacidiphilus pinicola TaxID=2219663 RepID=UPI001A9FF430|nr:iron ABC transporter substrate-binding protein [Streptacidiphilus pinicola]